MIPTGYTPTILKVCIRCGRVHDDALYMLCPICRDGDAVAEYFKEKNAADQHELEEEQKEARDFYLTREINRP